ncbi:hypothetical protein C4J97_0194 [Pseudomonas orientalis]|nr:hypothetical protein C4J97_0194 [Pseudomonas orientalis]
MRPTVARELAPAGLRSSPRTRQPRCSVSTGFGSASHSSGSKLPRHNKPHAIVSIRYCAV